MYQAKYAIPLAKFFGIEPEDIPQALIEGAGDESRIDDLDGSGGDDSGGVVLGLSRGTGGVGRGVDTGGGGHGNRE